MPRREFPRAVKVAVVKRCTRENQVWCESCGLPAKKWQIDHVRPDGLGGEPTIENAQLLCLPCAVLVKNPADTSAIARAKRREAAHLGARPTPKRTLRSKGFGPKRERPEKLPVPGPKALYREVQS